MKTSVFLALVSSSGSVNIRAKLPSPTNSLATLGSGLILCVAALNMYTVGNSVSPAKMIIAGASMMIRKWRSTQRSAAEPDWNRR